MKDDIKQPPIKGGPIRGVSPFRAGTPRSYSRLKQLQFDPIEQLVIKYREIENEIEYQNKRRSGEIVELLPNGKLRPYSYEHHMALYDRLLRVGEQLLRYGYGRVPEVIQVEEKKVEPLVVNLTKKGETYVINESIKHYVESEYDGELDAD